MPSATRSAIILAGAAVLTVTVAVGPASANVGSQGQLRVDKTISDAYVGPLQFVVSRYGTYVADGFTSTLNKVGVEAPIATGGDPATGGDVGGVAVNPNNGDVAYTTSNGDHSQTYLIIRRGNKEIRRVDLAAYERDNNPDGKVTYGAYKPSACARKAIEDTGMPANYTGQIDSHPYAVAYAKDGGYVVADAGGNDLLYVTKNGSIHTIAVVQRRLWTIPAEFVEENHLPSCVTGTRYFVEGVPTDVEFGPDRSLYFSSLPGSDAANLGAVYRLKHRHLTRIGDGFNNAVNIAVTKHGNVYVAELGSGRISKISHGAAHPVLDLPGVVGVEAYGGHLYASVAPALIGQEAPGSIVRLGKARPSS